jgi:hypothetical protein
MVARSRWLGDKALGAGTRSHIDWGSFLRTQFQNGAANSFIPSVSTSGVSTTFPAHDT